MPRVGAPVPVRVSHVCLALESSITSKQAAIQQATASAAINPLLPATSRYEYPVASGALDADDPKLPSRILGLAGQSSVRKEWLVTTRMSEG